MIEPLANDVQGIKNDLVEIKSDIEIMKNDIVEMKSEIVEIKDRLENVEIEVVKTNLKIENELIPSIQAIREGQRGFHEKFDILEKRTDEIEEDIIVLKVLTAKK